MSSSQQKLAPAYRQKLRQPSFWLSFIKRVCLVFVIISMTLLLLAQLGGRLLLPFISDYKDDIASQFSQFLQAKISIDSIEARFEYFIPYIDINGISMQPNSAVEALPISPNSSEALPQRQYIHKLSIGINPFNMARAKSWLPNDITVHGLEVLIIKNRDGSFSLPAINPPKPNQNRDYESVLNALKHKLIKVSAGKLQIYNSSTARSLNIAPIRLDYLSSGEHRQGYLSVKPAQAIGGQSYLRFGLEGHLREPQTWVGNLDLDIKPIQMRALLPYLPDTFKIKSGHAGIKLSASFDKTNIKSSRGELDIVAELENGERLLWQSPISIVNRAADFNLRAEKPLSFANQSVDVLSDAGLEINFSERLQLGFYSRAFDLNALPQLLATIKALPQSVVNKLRQSKMQGAVEHLFAGWDAREGWVASAQVARFQSRDSGFIPGILAPKQSEGIRFNLSYRKQKLQLFLDKIDFDFQLSKLYTPIFKVRNLTGVISLIKLPDSWLLESHDNRATIDQTIDVSANWQLKFGNGAPLLKLSIDAPYAPFKSVARYTPKIIGRQAKKWFDQAFISGDIKDIHLEIDGDVRHIADNRSNTLFKVSAKGENARFSFEPSWPQVHSAYGDFLMDKAQISIKSNRASSEKLSIDNIDVRIADVRRLAVAFDLKASQQDLSEMFAYIKTEQLQHFLAPLSNNFTAYGKADLDLNFAMNISNHYSSHLPKVRGKLHFNKAATLLMPALNLKLSQLYGTLEFSEQSLFSRHLHGSLNGAPLDAYINTIDQNKSDMAPSVEIMLSSWLHPLRIFPNELGFITPFIEGESYWTGLIHFGLGKNARAANIKIASQLYDSSLQLPEPFAKTSKSKRLFEFQLPLVSKTIGTQSGYLASLRFDDSLLTGDLWFDQHFKLQSGRIAIQGRKPQMPSTGFAINANFHQFKLEPWLDYFHAAMPAADQSQGTQNSGTLHLHSLNLSAKNFIGSNFNFANLKAKILRDTNSFFAAVDSEFIELSLRAPLDFANLKQAVPVRIKNLDLNQLHQRNRPSNSTSINPALMPPLQVQIDQFKYKNVVLNNIYLQTKSRDHGLTLDQFSLLDHSIKIAANGSWYKENSKDFSELHIDWSSANIKNDLAKFGINNLIEQGNTRLKADLNWQAPLYTLDLASLGGTLELHASDGIISAVKPRAGKLLGLLNPKSLPKRLLGNFDDFAQSGLLFSNLDAAFLLKNGIAQIDKFQMTADLGTINLQGRVDLVKQTVQQIAAISPEVSTVLPIAALALGGIPGFVGGWMVERLYSSTKSNDIALIRYTISGDWHDPQVEATQIKTVRDLTPSELAQRLEQIKAQQRTIQTPLPAPIRAAHEE